MSGSPQVVEGKTGRLGKGTGSETSSDQKEMGYGNDKKYMWGGDARK